MTKLESAAHEAARRLYDRLKQAQADNGGSIHKAEWLAIAGGQFKAAMAAAPQARRGGGRGRDPGFDSLAAACGVNLDQMTRSHARAIAVALADIRAVNPAVTPAELSNRVLAYRTRHPAWVLTAPAVAAHWASLGGGEATRTGKLDIYQEPGGWDRAAAALWGMGVAGEMAKRAWADLSPDWRADMLRWLAAN